MPIGSHATIYIGWEIYRSRFWLSHAFCALTYKLKRVRHWTSHVLSITAAPAWDEGHLSSFPLLTWARLSVHVPSYIPLGLPGPIHSLIQHTAIHHCDSQTQTSFIIRQRWEEDQRCSAPSCLCTILILHYMSDILLDQNWTDTLINASYSAPKCFIFDWCTYKTLYYVLSAF